jgi:hypothetical protein
MVSRIVRWPRVCSGTMMPVDRSAQDRSGESDLTTVKRSSWPRRGVYHPQARRALCRIGADRSGDWEWHSAWAPGRTTVRPWPTTSGQHDLLRLVLHFLQYVWKRPEAATSGNFAGHLQQSL